MDEDGTRLVRKRAWLERVYPLLGFFALVGAVIACSSGTNSYQGYDLGDQVQWQCPTATPVSTATPTYPGYLSVTPLYTDVNSSSIFFLDQIAVIAQNTGNVYFSMTYYDNSGTVVVLNSNVLLGYVGGYPPGGYQTFWPVALIWYGASGLFSITVTTDSGLSQTAFILTGPYDGWIGPNQPCYTCVPAVILPTAVPTATPFIRTNEFFLNDWVVINYNGLKVGVRITWQNADGSDAGWLPGGIPTTRQDTSVSPPQPQEIYVWKVEIYNVGQVPYDSFPYLQSYVSDLVDAGTDPYTDGGKGLISNVWGPSAWAINEVMPSRFSETWGPTLEPFNGYAIPPEVMTPSYLRSRELGTCGCPNSVVCFPWGYDFSTGKWKCFQYDLDGDLGLSPNPQLIPTEGAQARGPYGFLTDRVLMAAYGPVNKQIWKVGFALNMKSRPTPGVSNGDTGAAPTGVPGNDIAWWINHPNPNPACQRPNVQP
jgi:hypothetical protein